MKKVTYSSLHFVAASVSSAASRARSADNSLRGSNADMQRSVDRLSQPKPKRAPVVHNVQSPSRPRQPITPTRPRDLGQKPALTPVKNNASTPNKVWYLFFIITMVV